MSSRPKEQKIPVSLKLAPAVVAAYEKLAHDMYLGIPTSTMIARILTDLVANDHLREMYE